jgi:Carbohydrate esterase, sialic acid-specific acetylesterase
MTSSLNGKFASDPQSVATEHVGRRRRWLSFGLVSAVMACGVAEHPHESGSAPVNACGDFEPCGGTGAVTPTGGTNAVAGTGVVATGGASVGTAGTGATSGGTGASTGGTGASTGGSGVTTGGTGVSTGGTGVTTGGAAPTAGAASTGGTSGMTITLGGATLTPDKVVAFIHVGHSNMAGRARSPSGSRAYHFTETHPHAYMYKSGSSPALALEPKTAGDTESIQGNTGGPGTALVKQAAVMAPNTYFVSLGFGMASAYCSQFLPGALYYDKLIAAPKAIKGRVTFGGIFIYLGITERHGTEADRTSFAQCINKLATAIRNDVGVPDLPVLLNDYETGGTGEFAVSGAVYKAIKPQIDMVPTVVSNSALVSADGIGMQDDHHFNFDGQKMWTQRALDTMKSKGWFKWM